MSEILIIGYGNTIRGDDGVGPAVAEALQARYAGSEQVSVLACHQLVPEMAPMVAAARCLILIDAVAGGVPGETKAIDLKPEPGDRPSLAHFLDPRALLATAKLLYGAAPPTTLFTVCAMEFDGVGRLSPPVSAALPPLTARIAALVETAVDQPSP